MKAPRLASSEYSLRMRIAKISLYNLYHLPGGHRRQKHTSSDGGEEIMRARCLEMNVRSVAEQQEFTLCYIAQRQRIVNGEFPPPPSVSACSR
uniref:Uncharacterized protein n=1 Tax=Globodera rostochiensis TaxID=31243 RepID=A0A914GXX8_GLORO